MKLEAALATLAGNGYSLAMIDTAGADTAAAAAAMRAARFCCFIPARPTAFDIRATEKTRDAIKTSAASTRSSSTNARRVLEARAPTMVPVLWS